MLFPESDARENRSAVLPGRRAQRGAIDGASSARLTQEVRELTARIQELARRGLLGKGTPEASAPPTTVKFRQFLLTLQRRGGAMLISFKQAKPASAPRTSSLRDLMTRDHQRLDSLFRDLVIAWNAGDRDETRRVWRVFTAGLNHHMELEERLVFPAFKRAHARELRELELQHQQVRRRALEVSDAVEGQSLRTEALRAFIGALRTHAASEDALMYTWADEQHCAPVTHDGERVAS